jgi:DNA repair protein RadC
MNTIQRQFEFSPEVAEVELHYKTRVRTSDMPAIHSSKDAESLFRKIWPDSLQHHECFYILLVNRANRVLGHAKISEGGSTGTVVDAGIIFEAVILSHAYAFIMAHNHPSGNLTPSQEDKNITSKLRDGGKLLDKALLDHLIITDEGYYSFADEGTL